MLLSSLFVYNQMGGIDESALDRLSLVTEMTKHIRVRAGAGKTKAPSGFVSDVKFVAVHDVQDVMTRVYATSCRDDLITIGAAGMSGAEAAKLRKYDSQRLVLIYSLILRHVNKIL